MRGQGEKMELICYLSYGYPTLEESLHMAARYAEAGCGIIEAGLPSRNPYMENEVIAGQMRQALENCGNYEIHLAKLAQMKGSLPQIHFLLLVYEDTVCEIGVETFTSFCRKQGFSDIILTGVRGKQIKEQLMGYGLYVSCYVTSPMPEEEVEQAIQSNGFVYLQAKPYREEDSASEYSVKSLRDRIVYLREVGIDRPIYCGVGISTAQDVRRVRDSGADGVFAGSAVLKLQEHKTEQVSLIRQMKEAGSDDRVSVRPVR